MPLKAALKSIEGLDPNVAALYRKDEQAGLYLLDVEPAEEHSLAPVAKLQGALNKERQRASELEKQVKAWDGLDPVAAREATQRLGLLATELEEARKGKVDVEKVVREREAAVMERAKKDLEKMETTVKRYRGVLERSAQAELSAALAKAGANPKALPMLQTYFGRFLRLREDGENLTTEVVDENGVARVSPKDYSRGMTIEEFVESVKGSESHADWFAGSGAAGANTPPKTSGNSAPSGGKRVVSRADMAAGNVSPEDILAGKVEFRD